MNLNKFLGKPIIATLSSLKSEFSIVEYSKVEGDEFIKLPEQGFYLQSRNNASIISDYRLYIQPSEQYFELAQNISDKYRDVLNIEELQKMLGQPSRTIASLKISGTKPTLPGFKFLDVDANLIISAYYDVSGNVVYIHIKQDIDYSEFVIYNN